MTDTMDSLVGYIARGSVGYIAVVNIADEESRQRLFDNLVEASRWITHTLEITAGLKPKPTDVYL